MISAPLKKFSVPALAALLVLAARADDTIKIGEYASLTGKEAAFGQSSDKGTQLAIAEINAAGGVLSQKLELVTEDDQSKPGEASTAVRKLIARDKAVAILGEVASSRSIEAAPVCQASHIPMISPSSTNPKVTEIGSYIFRVCFTDPFQGKVLAKFAKDSLHARRVAVLTSVTSAYSVGLAKYFIEPFTADGGIISDNPKYTDGDKDFHSQLTTIKASGCDALFIPGYYTEVGLICKQAHELGLNVPIFGGDGWEAPELIEIGGADVEGCYYSTHYSPKASLPAVQAFVKKFRARFDGETPDAMAALGYDSAMILADAIRRARSTDGEKIRDALAATKDFPGITGKTTIDEHRNATKSAVIITVKNGQFEFVQTVEP
jgi:branched-chain amino acid transport system substrate-binding protein